ncbi:hypothetical protein E2562_020866 [Oryza meyeriana var. granulata]|uniref:Uncharacterized protein n=1 Tax=Oryza meyeriana var. granulata TaxID=110450 RepID=A0A6G1D654_9ORYZ|nr:hypothetical protein E2562_020866 [Oryza meyeriana var. granulata]
MDICDCLKASSARGCAPRDLLLGRAQSQLRGIRSLPDRGQARRQLPQLQACSGMGRLGGIYNDFKDLGLEAPCARGLLHSPLE